MSSRQFFQYLSYLQYPLLAVTVYFAVQAAVLMGKGQPLSSLYDPLNYMLLFAGVAVGLSSLQDTTKTQNKISLKTWQNPAKGRFMLIVMALEAFIPIVMGLVGAFRANDTAMNQLSLGMVAFGLGMIGLLKTAIEMRENFRLDRNPINAEVAQ